AIAFRRILRRPGFCRLLHSPITLRRLLRLRPSYEPVQLIVSEPFQICLHYLHELLGAERVQIQVCKVCNPRRRALWQFGLQPRDLGPQRAGFPAHGCSLFSIAFTRASSSASSTVRTWVEISAMISVASPGDKSPPAQAASTADEAAI